MQSNWIGNKAVPGSGGEIVVVNPATEEIIDAIPKGTPEDADAAVNAAHRAFPGWAALSPTDRRNAIRTGADKLAAIRDVAADLLTREMGKPLPQAAGEINAAIDAMRSYAELVVHLRSGHQMSATGELNFQHRVARGARFFLPETGRRALRWRGCCR